MVVRDERRSGLGKEITGAQTNSPSLSPLPLPLLSPSSSPFLFVIFSALSSLLQKFTCSSFRGDSLALVCYSPIHLPGAGTACAIYRACSPKLFD